MLSSRGSAVAALGKSEEGFPGGFKSYSLSVLGKQQYHALPRDLRDFYLTTNGMLLRWSVREADGEVAKLGRLSVSPLDKLLPVSNQV